MHFNEPGSGYSYQWSDLEELRLAAGSALAEVSTERYTNRHEILN